MTDTIDTIAFAACPLDIAGRQRSTALQAKLQQHYPPYARLPLVQREGLARQISAALQAAVAQQDAAPLQSTLRAVWATLEPPAACAQSQAVAGSPRVAGEGVFALCTLVRQSMFQALAPAIAQEPASGLATLERYIALLEEVMYRETHPSPAVPHAADDEAALAPMLAVLQATLEATADGALALGPDGSLLGCNRRLAEIWHVPADWLEQSTYSQRLAPLIDQVKDPVAFVGRMEAIAATTDASDFERLELADGRIFEHCSRPYCITGRQVGRVWSFRDVTERMRTEAALQATQARLNVIFDHATVGIALIRRGGGYIAANQCWAEMLGYQQEELYQATNLRATHPEDVEAGRKQMQDLLAGTQERFSLEKRYLRKDGTSFWGKLSVAAVPSPADQFAEMLCIITDITACKQAVVELQQSEACYRAVVEDQTELICRFKPDRTLTFVNDAFCACFGRERATLIGGDFLHCLRREEREQARQQLASLSPRNPTTTWEHRVLTPGGDVYWLEWTGRAIVRNGPGGHRIITEVQAVGHNISDRMRTELALKRRAAELEGVNTELEAFSYSVAHDLRKPLWAIDLLGQTLLEQYGHQLDEQGRDFVQRISATARQMAHVIDDLLGLSNVSHSTLQVETVSLSDLACSILNDLQQRHPERCVEIVIAEHVLVRGDAWLLRIALENLLGNAWKFTSKQPQARIEFGVSRQNGMTAYFVDDNGVGFDQARAHKLFGAFERLHSADEFPGTGIGLATVKRIITRHGGRVWARGCKSQGATVYFTLLPS